MTKYPLLMCLIISSVLIVASLFISGFFGIKLGTTLGGGSQFEVTISNDANAEEYVSDIKSVLGSNKLTFDSCTVEDNYQAGDNFGEYTERCLIVKVVQSNVSDEVESAVQTQIAEKLGISVSKVSAIDNIVSSIKSRDILFIGLGVGIVAICFFVLGWIRYGIFAGLSFILSFIHNIILFLALMILTRIPLGLISIAAALVLTLLVSTLLIAIFERYRAETALQTAEKTTVSERMLSAEKETLKAYSFIGVAVFVFALILLFVPVPSVLFAAASIILTLVSSAYTGLLIGPGVCAALLEIQDANQKAALSRNDTVNKVIKKKIKKNTK